MTRTQRHECNTAVFPLLANPQAYTACAWDLTADHDKRAYWLSLFRRHLPSLLDEAIAEAGDDPTAKQRARACRDDFFAYLDAVGIDPKRFGRLDILAICHARERALRRAGFDDPYRLAKQRENDLAMKLLPGRLNELDTMPPSDRVPCLIEGVFAGNIFDLGAPATIDLFKNDGVDFPMARQKLQPRPWRFDDLDAWVQRITQGQPYRAAVLFVDNAGPDILLGMVPLARDLLQRGTQVILTANSTPALNDVTHDELAALIDQIAAWDATVSNALGDGRLELVPSGNGAPLIDLKHVSGELVEAVERRDADLVVLEGMGRTIETNFDATFRCDALKIAMIKDPGVAGSLGAQLYDLVFRFAPGAVQRRSA